MRMPDWGFEWSEMLRGYQTEYRIGKLQEGRIKAQYTGGRSGIPSLQFRECSLQIVAVTACKDFQWNRCVCQVIKSSIPQITYSCQLGKEVFPRQ